MGRIPLFATQGLALRQQRDLENAREESPMVTRARMRRAGRSALSPAVGFGPQGEKQVLGGVVVSRGASVGISWVSAWVDRSSEPHVQVGYSLLRVDPRATPDLDCRGSSPINHVRGSGGCIVKDDSIRFDSIRLGLRQVSLGAKKKKKKKRKPNFALEDLKVVCRGNRS